MKKVWILSVLALAVAIGCGEKPQEGTAEGERRAGGSVTLLTGSESEPLRPLVEKYARDHDFNVSFESKGAVDIMIELKSGQVKYDGIWPSNSMWVTLSGNKSVKDGQSIMRTPVVLWVKKSVVQELGWIAKTIKVQDVLDAADSGKLSLLMTSATQSNSGASAYFGYLSAFTGQGKTVEEAQLRDPTIRAKIKSFYSNVKHSFGSSKWLKDYFIEHYGEFNAMVNYESLGIEANQALASSGQEPLYAIYPVDGLAIADCPLYLVDHGDDSKNAFIRDLQKFLKSPEAQRQITALGWRTGDAGLGEGTSDPGTFNPEWGVDTKRIIQPIRFPSGAIVDKALVLYQTALRKPIARVYCIDFSGSMEGDGVREVKQAMRINLDPGEAAKHFLQIGPDDITTVITFDDKIIHTWTVKGNDPKELEALNLKVQKEQIRGGTNIYQPVQLAMENLHGDANLERHLVSVVLMTDGRSQGGSIADVQNTGNSLGFHVPVYTISFGDADTDQLKEIASKTGAKFFDGKKDLVKTFREVSGYN